MISTIPIIILTIFNTIHSKDYINLQLMQSYEQVITQYQSNLNYRIKQSRDIAVQLSLNTYLHEVLTSTSNASVSYDNSQMIGSEIARYLRLDLNIGLDNCIVYSNTDRPAYHGNLSNLSSAKQEVWYPNYQTSTSDTFVYQKFDKKTMLLSFVHTIIATDFYKPYYGQNLGIVKIDVNTATLFSPNTVIENRYVTSSNTLDTSFAQNETNFDVLVYSKDNHIIYSSKQHTEEELNHLKSQVNQFEAELFQATLGNDDIFLFSSPVAGTELNLFILLPMDAFSKRMSAYYVTTIIIVGISLFLSFIIAFIISRNFSNRLNFLLYKMKRVENGDLSAKNTILEGVDELSIIDNHFNAMISTLEKSINTNYIAKLEKQEAELQSLQLQINPHFLYNTLETISSIAMTNNVYLIGEICENLGEMFRFSMNKEREEFVPLFREIQHTKNYIYIQQVRFPHDFEVFYNIDPVLKQRLIPRFIIQPIVENSILHGLQKKSEKGCLELSVYEEENKLIISVDDDGIGMEDTKVVQLNEYINDSSNNVAKDHKASIGVKNVHRRIQFAYGKDYGIIIKSKPSQGTSVMIVLPLYGK